MKVSLFFVPGSSFLVRRLPAFVCAFLVHATATGGESGTEEIFRPRAGVIPASIVWSWNVVKSNE
jgi:hypothetical protein